MHHGSSEGSNFDGKDGSAVEKTNNAGDIQSKPTGKEIFGMSVLVVGIVLVLAAIVVMMVLSLRNDASEKTESSQTQSQPIAPPPAVPADVTTKAANPPQAAVEQTPAPPPNVEAKPAPPPTPAAPAPAASTAENEPPRDAGAAEPAKTDDIAIPPLVTGGPNAEISNFVQSIQVCGKGSDKILLLMPGQEEARAYHEGDMLDCNFELSVQKIEDQKIVVVDSAGNKYYKAF